MFYGTTTNFSESYTMGPGEPDAADKTNSKLRSLVRVLNGTMFVKFIEKIAGAGAFEKYNIECI